MYCPHCMQPNIAAAPRCRHCQQDLSGLAERVFIGQQFIFVRADDQHPLALKVDDAAQVFRAPLVLARHLHAIAFGDETVSAPVEEWKPALPDLPRLTPPALRFLTLVTDRKIYRPGDDATLFIIAPDAAHAEVTVEIKLGGQKVYEAKVLLNRDGLALHRYADVKEGEYTVNLNLPDQPGVSADCSFSVAEFVLSPFIAVLEEHRFAGKKLTFSLKLTRLSVLYNGPVEFGLQCAVCGERVVATQRAAAKDGAAPGEFDLSSHGGPFHVQVTTPDGDTASVAFPGTGAQEREAIVLSELGAQTTMSLLPREDDEPVRGFYVGSGGVNMTPLMLEKVCAPIGQLRAAADLAATQIVIFDPRSTSEARVLDRAEVKRGELIEFASDAPYTFFTVGAFQHDRPWEGWGIVVKPIEFEAALHAPATAKPGDLIDVSISISSGVRGFCWLLVYDARLEHESPLPKLAKRIYESARDASRALAVGEAKSAQEKMDEPQTPLRDRAFGAVPMPVAAAPMADGMMPQALRAASMVAAAPAALFAKRAPAMETEAPPVLVVAPTRMEFPELVFNELLFMEGQAARTVRLGDQIGLWRVRAYVIDGVDVRELTADVQVDQALYAELDVPAIASTGDDLSAAVNYFTREPAELIVATPWDEKRFNVSGAGKETIAIRGPGRVEARISTAQDSDWTQRDIAPPGVQRVTASRLMILDKGQTARGEKVVVYETPGQVLKDTITALIRYPFG
jgi:hypothetical protein